MAVAMTGVAGVLGALVAVGRDERISRWQWIAITALGVGAFAFARTYTTPVPVLLTPFGVAATSLAAVSEELFFRRLMYGWLMRWGPVVAIGLSAVAFALIHLHGYGAWALPLDLAAGLLFGWQRWASGGWTAPALAHLAANLMQLG
jgi:hypothetical protein